MSDDDPVPDDDSPVPYHKAAVHELYAEGGQDLEDYVRKRLRDDTDSIKDVVSQCWVDLTRKWQRQGELSQPRRLLFRIAQQRMIDRIRQISPRCEIPEADQNVLDELAAALRVTSEFVSAVVVRVDMRAALAELPPRQRTALLLVHGYGLSHQDTAALMGVQPHTVNNVLRAGRERLRKSRRLTGYWTSTPPAPPEVNT